MKRTAIIIYILLQYFCTKGQNQTALPQIINYHSYEYKAGVQNWSIDQDENGLLYFGNSEGLLSFDGKFWRRYQLPHQTIVRSLKASKDGRIYVGGQDQIGYFSPDRQGRLQYHSLNQLVPAQDRNFSDIWNISLYNDEIFFQSKNKIFQLKDGTIKVYLPEKKWAFMGRGGSRLYAQEHGKGLVMYDNGTWKPACDNPVLAESAVTGILDYSKDTLLVMTLKKGLFLLHQNTLIPKQTNIDHILTRDRLYCSAKVNDNWYALGTNSAGIFIVDKEGRQIQTYSYREGLQKNNIRSLLLDRNKNLWTGLDDGIDLIAINSAIKYIYPDKTKQVTGYATRIFDNKLYVGTSNGVYVSPVDLSQSDLSHSGSSFTEVGNTSGQVWNLEEVNDRLLIGHEDGCLIVNGNTASRIYGGAGSWLFRPTTQVFPAAHVLAGTYTGLRHFKAEGGGFTDLGQLDGVNESLRFFSLDDRSNVVWAAHPNRGIYRIELSPDYTRITGSRLFDKKDGLPANNGNYLYRIKNRLVVTTLSGVYEFNPATARFEPSKTLYPVFNDLSIQYLHEDREGNIWFITNKKVGVVDYHKPSGGKNHSIVHFPELSGMALGGYESIYSWNSENIFIAGNKGIIHVNYKKYGTQNTRPDVHLSQVKVTGEKDSLLYGGYPVKQTDLRLGSKYSSLHFEYSSTMFEQLQNIEFSYQLEGFDRAWSAWSTKSEKDYTNLPPGTYTFAVKARNNLGNESPAARYSFEVTRPWYSSYWLYSLYVCLLAGLIYLVLRWQQQKHRKEQAHLNYLHQLELDRNEKEIVKLKNEKLETDISFKNSELLTMTINLVQRGEVLTRIREIISSLIKKDTDGESTPAFRNLLKLIREVEKSNEDWDQFAIHFNNVNFDFFNNLKQAYPDLTPNDLKLCAYLRMNLSSKEIAQLLNITLKAVEIARYRLRKKLQLSPDTNLTDFLTGLTKIPINN
ncbi:triple tyrosine motif-containing protein [Chitinophaga barathri]|uniref:Transcriptional regulator n=1 Tax=Chitinophaga barathri TaxID=1647451 RepID=A0A3N4MGL2_9BACT|nr:triple tyrosine motif-containing protein [Chitinophaga barathri]RPD41156.1 transcriptional regulator [Chitinophaga barathri]